MRDAFLFRYHHLSFRADAEREYSVVLIYLLDDHTVLFLFLMVMKGFKRGTFFGSHQIELRSTTSCVPLRIVLLDVVPRV